MTKSNKLLFFISLLVFTGVTAQKSKTSTQNILPDWRKDTFNYAKQIVPSKIKNDNTGELIPVTLKKDYITKADNDPVVLAICTVENGHKETSSLTYFFINPKTNQIISKFKSVLTVKGCDLTIPAFVIKDIDGDKKDDFIFLELYNDRCKGDYRISSNFHQIKPETTKNELDYYLKLRNDIRINRKVTTAETGQLQKKLEEVVAELFNH
ncbi:hypothetical protein [Chryseobacterium sp. NFX27]|uniref:hypothetical protein n=1 Tax=Chryseobacterium sp. NFX27 TaxID=2819618 RepID=UPI003CF43F0A